MELISREYNGFSLKPFKISKIENLTLLLTAANFTEIILESCESKTTVSSNSKSLMIKSPKPCKTLTIFHIYSKKYLKLLGKTDIYKVMYLN